jgi:hypothetical protein
MAYDETAAADNDQTPRGVATAGPWTWQRREVEDVMSPLFMEPDSIAHLEQRNHEHRQWRSEQGSRLSVELLRTGEYFSAAVRKIRARQAQGD